MKEWQFETYGKWILSGEHAVLRGVPALVFPLKERAVRFHLQSEGSPLSVQFVGPYSNEYKLVFWGLMESALQRAERTRDELKGHLRVECQLPLGAGLGASAALCVGVAKIFSSQRWISASDEYEFARQLESLFHGESSGVDIAVALDGHAIRFMRGGERTPFEPGWQPQLYLSYSGQRGATSDCVRKVYKLLEQSPELADKIDQQMRDAVEMAERSFEIEESVGFQSLAHSIDLARDCFYQWGLCDGPLDEHMRALTKAGALAVKPTGSGGGGYVLSLWRDEPKDESINFIPALFCKK